MMILNFFVLIQSGVRGFFARRDGKKCTLSILLLGNLMSFNAYAAVKPESIPLPKLLITRDYNGEIGKPYGVDKGIPAARWIIFVSATAKMNWMPCRKKSTDSSMSR